MDDVSTYQEVLARASSFLTLNNKDSDAAMWLLLNRLGWTKTDWLMHHREKIPIQIHQQFNSDIEQLLEDYPPQYIIGKTDFFGREFKVTKETLIPRPETEELVELCLETVVNNNVKVVDIGTGSGAIALTLKKERPNWDIVATDISERALEVAKVNANQLNASIDFREGDLIEPIQDERFDVVISNPPYISYDEKNIMGESVLKFEPHVALFADNNGLFVYEQLANSLSTILNENGMLFLEIGYSQGNAVRELFQQQFPTREVRIKKDLSGKDRFVSMI